MLRTKRQNHTVAPSMPRIWGNILVDPVLTLFKGSFPCSVIWDGQARQYFVGINGGIESHTPDLLPTGPRFAQVAFQKSPYLVDFGETLVAVECSGSSTLRLRDKKKDRMVLEVGTDLIIGRILPFSDGFLALCTSANNKLAVVVYDRELNEIDRIEIDAGLVNVPDGDVVPTAVLDGDNLLFLSQRDASFQRFLKYDAGSRALNSIGKYPVRNMRGVSLASHGGMIFVCGLHGIGICTAETEFVQFAFVGGLWGGQLSVVNVEGVPYLFCCAPMNGRVLRWKINTEFGSVPYKTQGCSR